MKLSDEQIEELYKNYILAYDNMEEYEKYSYNTESEFLELLNNGEIAEITPKDNILTKKTIVETALDDMLKRNQSDQNRKDYEIYSDLETYLAMYIVFTLNNKLYIERN